MTTTNSKPATMADIAMLADWITGLRLQVENHNHDEADEDRECRDWPIVVVDHPLRCGVCARPIGGVRGIAVSALLEAVRRHIDECPGRTRR